MSLRLYSPPVASSKSKEVKREFQSIILQQACQTLRLTGHMPYLKEAYSQPGHEFDMLSYRVSITGDSNQFLYIVSLYLFPTYYLICRLESCI